MLINQNNSTLLVTLTPAMSCRKKQHNYNSFFFSSVMLSWDQKITIFSRVGNSSKLHFQAPSAIAKTLQTLQNTQDKNLCFFLVRDYFLHCTDQEESRCLKFKFFTVTKHAWRSILGTQMDEQPQIFHMNILSFTTKFMQKYHAEQDLLRTSLYVASLTSMLLPPFSGHFSFYFVFLTFKILLFFRLLGKTGLRDEQPSTYFFLMVSIEYLCAEL